MNTDRKDSGFLHVVLDIEGYVCIPLGVGTLCNKQYVHVHVVTLMLYVVCTVTIVCSLEFFLHCRLLWSLYPLQGEMAATRMLMLPHKLPQLADEICGGFLVYSTVICSFRV